MVDKLFFIFFAVLAVAGAIGVITRTNVVHGLILLVFTFVNIAAIYMLTQAYFLAVIQVLVYAGAILVLFAFVVMFLNLREFREVEQLYAKQKWLALVLAPLMLAEFVVVTVGATYESVKGGLTPETIAAAGGNVRAVGMSLFNDMLLPFEVASLILLAGMIGAIVLAKKEDSPDMSPREWTGDEESVREIVEQEV
jgi:NADH-quinone oxidoreductase subunit J